MLKRFLQIGLLIANEMEEYRNKEESAYPDLLCGSRLGHRKNSIETFVV